MKLIGLTGPSGAGKGAITTVFAEYGIPSVDTDRVYHDLLIPPSALLDELRQAFSDDILNADGTLNRTVLSTLVFEPTEQGKARLQTLNRIAHQAVITASFAWFKKYEEDGRPAAILDAPLLIEAGLADKCDLVVAVLADRDTRMKRLLARDDRSQEQLTARLDAQPDDNFYRSNADVVIENNGTLAQIRDQVRAILTRLEVSL